MPIEFRCTSCNQLLSTPDGSQGRQAKCPACGAILTVPEPSVVEPVLAEVTPPSIGTNPKNVFGNSYANNSQQSGGASPVLDTDGSMSGLLDIAETFRRTWEIFKVRWEPFLIASFIVFGLNFLVGMMLSLPRMIAVQAAHDHGIALVIPVLMQVVQQVFSAWLYIGLIIVFLKILRGQNFNYAEIFSGGRYLIPLLLAWIVMTVCIAVGLILLIIPGIILALMLSQTWYLIIDRNLGIFEALDASSKAMQGNKLTLLVIHVCAAIIGLAIILCTCFVGIVVVMPLSVLLQTVIYLIVTKQPMIDPRVVNPPQER